MNAPETFASLQAVCSVAPNGLDIIEGGSMDESLAYLMRRVVVSLAHQVNRKLDARGLTHAQWTPLMKLRGGGPSTVADLARGCRVDAGAMSRLLDRLEKKNLCRRARSTADRRVVRVELTDDGEAAVAQVRSLPNEVLDAHLAGFTRTERQALERYLQRMVKTGEAIREGG